MLCLSRWTCTMRMYARLETCRIPPWVSSVRHKRGSSTGRSGWHLDEWKLANELRTMNDSNNLLYSKWYYVATFCTSVFYICFSNLLSFCIFLSGSATKSPMTELIIIDQIRSNLRLNLRRNLMCTLWHVLFNENSFWAKYPQRGNLL